MPLNRCCAKRVFSAWMLVAATALPAMATGAQTSEDTRIDYLSLAQGALPLSVGGNPAARVTTEHALKVIDGHDGGFAFARPVDPALPIEFVYELPVSTTFDRFAVPNVLETPSPSQTFVRDVSVLGSADSAESGFVTLASASLATHAQRGQVTELAVQQKVPVRWIKLVLRNGIDVQREQMFLEFSELVGNGTQTRPGEPVSLDGGWRGRGVAMLLKQDGAVVSGCYDRTGDLAGTVTGRILRATGIGRTDGVPSAFIAVLAGDGTIKGVRSTNGAPFRAFEAAQEGNVAGLGCPEPAPPVLGCGSIIHGIGFGFDSAQITPESAQVIEKLHEGLRGEAATLILIEGHTSSEGSEAYNKDLSERRARAVVAALQQRGLAAERLSAAGLGEARPIADNGDESGRSLNRRVEVHCRAP